MKIEVHYEDKPPKPLRVEDAKYAGGYRIRIYFSDGVHRTVDFKAFLNSFGHPSLKKYLSPKCFSQFEVKDGNLNWNDYEMIFPVADLYEGKV